MNGGLRFEDIRKHFPGVKALDGVSFDASAGAVHGLLGENGAGKSTLLKILGGQYRPDAGRIVIDGEPRHFANAAASIRAGIAVIHQELQYVPDLSVAENLLLGCLPRRFGIVLKREARRHAAVRLQALGVDLDPDARLKDLSIAQRQMVEICKALMRDARIIALDEPTSSLSHAETELLFRIVRDLKAQDRTLIYISHRLEELYALCDACTILRDGRKVATHPDLADVHRETLIREMVGRDIADIYDYKPRAAGAVRLSVRRLTGEALREPASFEVRGGEILGFFGLIGAGRSELMRLIYGADRKLSGEIWLDGRRLTLRAPRQAIDAGIVLCPEDRKEEGIVPHSGVEENINMSSRRHHARFGCFLDKRRERQSAEEFIRRLRIKTPHRGQPVRLLSGGNQQKVVLARWLSEPALNVVIFDEPTRGIDVGAKHEIYRLMYELAERGCAVLVVSSELPEVLGVADRILVMCQGRIRGELTRGAANEQKVLELALPGAQAA